MRGHSFRLLQKQIEPAGFSRQWFSGAMQKAEKGVFITTSKFTKEALDFANAESRKHIRLIDGDSLVELMIKHRVGLERIKEYIVYKIDEDYFAYIS